MKEITETQTINTTALDSPATERVQRTVVSSRPRKTQRVSEIIWFLFGVLNVLLALRIIFLLLGARSNHFILSLYSITSPFVVPFQGVFPAPAVSGAYLDTAAILAMIVYAIIAWGIAALIDLLLPEGEIV